MAKKKTQKMNGTSDYAQIQRNIQKAKGNPNKNVHQKKNGSDYHLRDRTPKENVQQPSKSRMPLWVKIALGVAFGLLLVMVILINTSLKGNPLAVHGTALITGLSCLLVYYSRRFLNKKETTGFKVISMILLLLGAIYAAMGAYGLYLNFGQ